MKVITCLARLVFVLLLAQGKLALALNTNLILFPGAFLPPHIGHFQNLYNQLKDSPNSDVLIVSYTSDQRDNVDSTVSAVVWSKYYFPILKKEFPDSEFKIVETPIDPHGIAFKEFSKESQAHKTGVVIAGDDRADYAEKMKAPFEKLKQSTGKTLKYKIMTRAEGVSATNLRKCIADAGESTGANFQNALKPCKKYFPSQITDAAFAEIGVLVSKNMQKNRANPQATPGAAPAAAPTKVIPTGKDKSPLPTKPLPTPKAMAKPSSQDELVDRFSGMPEFKNLSTLDLTGRFKDAKVAIGTFVLKTKQTDKGWVPAIVYKADAGGKVGIIELPIATTKEEAKAKIQELKNAKTITESIQK